MAYRTRRARSNCKFILSRPVCNTKSNLVFAEEKFSQALLDFLFYTDVGRVSGVAEEAENSDHEESSDGGT